MESRSPLLLNSQGPTTVINSSSYRSTIKDVVNYASALDNDGSFLLSTGITKYILPGVYLNRIYGLNGNAGPALFQSIPGIDLDDDTGALTDLLAICDVAASRAVQLKSRAIWIDSEAYNDYRNYHVEFVAGLQGISAAECVTKLEVIGAQIADTLAPYATLEVWTNFSSVGHDYWDGDYWYAPGYIWKGFLDRTAAQGYSLTLASCGQLRFGYCSVNMEALQTKVAARLAEFAALAESYPNLRAGACIAPWRDPDDKSGYWLTGDCGLSEFVDLEDFEPALRLLMESFDYVYVYAGTGTGYLANTAAIAAEFDSMGWKARFT